MVFVLNLLEALQQDGILEVTEYILVLQGLIPSRRLNRAISCKFVMIRKKVGKLYKEMLKAWRKKMAANKNQTWYHKKKN